jgi:hypothetical protein
MRSRAMIVIPEFVIIGVTTGVVLVGATGVVEDAKEDDPPPPHPPPPPHHHVPGLGLPVPVAPVPLHA